MRYFSQSNTCFELLCRTDILIFKYDTDRERVKRATFRSYHKNQLVMLPLFFINLLDNNDYE